MNKLHGWDGIFGHVWHTWYKYSAGIVVLKNAKTRNFFLLFYLMLERYLPCLGISEIRDFCFFVVPSGSGWKIAAVFALGRCRGRHTSWQDRRSTRVNDASVPRCRGLLQPAPPPVCSWLSKASLMWYVYPGTMVVAAFPVISPIFFVFLVRWFLKKKKQVLEQIILFAGACCIFTFFSFYLFRVSFSAKVYESGPHGACMVSTTHPIA